MRCLNFLQQVDSIGWILNTLVEVNTTVIVQKGCVLEADPD